MQPIDKTKVVETWLKNFPDMWNGLYLALSIVYPETSESWRLYYANQLELDPECENLKLQFQYGNKKENLLPTEDEFKLFLWDRANRERLGKDRLKAAFMLGQVAGYIKKDTGISTGITNNVIVLPQSPSSVDEWEKNAKVEQDKLRNVKVIEHDAKPL